MSGLQDSESRISNYLEAVEREIDHYKRELGEQEIKTIYFWGGTPNIIWFTWIQQIIQKIQQTWNVGNLAELSLECNPYPEDQIYDLVKQLNKSYKDFPRIRFSFGIQSMDDEILKRAGRPYHFVGMTQFLRWLREIKQENNVFNFDFIAFGKLKPNGELRDKTRMNFFTKFVQSHLAESFSLYTLELHENSKRYNQLSHVEKLQCWNGGMWNENNDENIMKEFEILKNKIVNFWYQRYEISNFCRRWCASVHNMVYWNMENYLWLWVSAASFLKLEEFGNRNSSDCMVEAPNKPIPNKPINQAIRWTNTNSLETYLKGERKDDSSLITLSEKDILIESFFLKLRTAEGISDISKYTEILVPNHEWLLTNYHNAWLVLYTWISLQLTDSGMDVSNSIITDLLQDI